MKSTLQHPLFLFSLTLLILHQLWQPLYPIWWIDAYLDDLLCMPIVLTILLFEWQFILKTDYQFSWFEVCCITLFIGVFYEEILPQFNADFTADRLDYLFYGLGSLGFYLFYNEDTEIFLLKT